MGRSTGWSLPASPCLVYEDTAGSRHKCIVRTPPLGSNMSEMETDRVRLVTHCLVTALFSSVPSTNLGKLNKGVARLLVLVSLPRGVGKECLV